MSQSSLITMFAFTLMALIFSGSSFDYDFDKAWKEVEQHMKKGLPKSALSQVELIYQAAQEADNEVQIIKATLYKTRLVLETEELGLERVVSDLDQAIAESDSPTKHILQSYAVEIFRSYYQSQYYRISQRTAIDDYIPTDIRTWAPVNYRDYVSALYLASVEGEDLTTTGTEDIKPLLERATSETDYELRPTLYDLLLDRALSYFSQTNLQGLQPSFRFVMADAQYLGTAADYRSLSITSDDELSLVYRAAVLYQKALANHEPGTRAHTDYNLKRLQFVKQYGTVPNANEVYLRTLDAEIEQSSGMAEFYYRFTKANMLHQSGRTKEALAEYETILALPLADNEKNKVRNQIAIMLRPELSVVAEQVYTAEEQALVRIDHKNLETAYLRIYELSKEQVLNLNSRRWNDDSHPFKNARVVSTKSIKLGMDASFVKKSKEVLLEKLPYGIYAVVVSNEDAFNHRGGAFQFAAFYVSDIGYSTQQLPDAEQVTVVDRNSGKALQRAEIDIYNLDYNNKQRRQERKFVATRKTDSKGQVLLSANTSQNNNVALVLRNDKDQLDLNTSVYLYRSSRERRVSQATEIFTDRAIYRPGQTVHWKLLAMRIDKYGKPSILQKANQTITLRDANYQEVTKMEVTTNEYGSASGTFTLPTGLLTGRFTIEGSSGSKTIQVEEYKRPKFEVEVDPVTAKIALGDTVTMMGKAVALSGSPVTDAKVSYSVTRHTYYGWWSWYRRSPSSSVQVAQGELVTTADGSYKFDFVAAAEANVDAIKNPTYTYEVSIDVTDMAGETRSATEKLSVSVLPYSYVIQLAETVQEHSDLKAVKLESKNTNGQAVESQATLTITELDQPSQWAKPRYWPVGPELTVVQQDRGQGRIAPPEDTGIDKYELGNKVYEANIDITTSGLELDMTDHLQAGKSYEIAMTSVEQYEDGVAITAKKRIAVKDSERGKLPPLKLLYEYGSDQKWEVGKPIDIVLGTPDGSVEVYYYFMRDWEAVKRGHTSVDKQTTISYTPSAADQGGISLFVQYTKYNRMYTDHIRLQIPWSDKELSVELLTRRDKVLPGSQEQWTLKISGPKGDKVAAEMLATMYDASLDQFAPHAYQFGYYRSHYGYLNNQHIGFNIGRSGSANRDWNKVAYRDVRPVYMPSLRSVGYYGVRYGIMKRRSSRPMMEGAEMDMSMDEVRSLPSKKVDMMAATAAGVSVADGDEEIRIRGSRSNSTEYFVDGVRVGDVASPTPPQITARKNLDETVFFYPHLRTDQDGNILVDFKMNEALTKWKLLTFAHDKDLRFGLASHEVQTQKDLMIVPNAPRFLREGDQLVFPATVSNLTEEAITANAILELVDPTTGKSVEQLFGLTAAQQSVSVPAGESARVDWTISVPADYKSLVKYIVKAWTAKHTDGEENVLPVVTNQKLVTETKVISVKKFETKTFESAALTKSSSTMVPHAFTFEYTSNPVWYAVQSLPYIMEYPHRCTEQIFNRLYANALASHISNANPRIKEIFDLWRATDSDALVSNLSKNEELKYALLEESPWVQEAQSETEQKKRIGLLFDMNKMAAEQSQVLQQLQERQLPDGSFPWFTGGRGDEYITQLVVMGIAHLQHLGVIAADDSRYSSLLSRAMTYLDEQSLKRYQLIRNKATDHLSYVSIQYLYIRSFFSEHPFHKGTKVAYDYYFDQAKKYWLGKGLYSEAILGLVMLRAEETVAADIKASLTERSFYSEELGRYWNQGSSYMWYQLPIETHAKMIEFFTEADQDQDFVEDTKIWLLKNKQTNHWKTTKATADAIYALLLQGEGGEMISWIEETNAPDIKFGSESLMIESGDLQAGTGYIKKRYEAADITKSMQSVTVKNNSETIGWGATYYQYFEQLDKIDTHAENPLTMTKKVYKETATDRGPVLQELAADGQLQVGDRVISRVEIKVDRDMDYVHLKDMRPLGFEPENVISSYKWQDGLGYYESTRDLASHFFISHLRKGTYVFEYPMRVVHKGDFSAGIATLQCMYAPEFTSHSDGVRVVVE